MWCLPPFPLTSCIGGSGTGSCLSPGCDVYGLLWRLWGGELEHTPVCIIILRCKKRLYFKPNYFVFIYGNACIKRAEAQIGGFTHQIANEINRSSSISYLSYINAMHLIRTLIVNWNNTYKHNLSNMYEYILSTAWMRYKKLQLTFWRSWCFWDFCTDRNLILALIVNCCLSTYLG